MRRTRPGTRTRMEHPRRPGGSGDDLAPPDPDATAAGAFAPPPGSGRSVLVFLSAVVVVTCGVAGALLLLTEVPAGYGLLLLAVALIAGVVLGAAVRRGRRRAAR